MNEGIEDQAAAAVRRRSEEEDNEEEDGLSKEEKKELFVKFVSRQSYVLICHYHQSFQVEFITFRVCNKSLWH